MNLLVAPPGSGKTTLLVKRARAVTQQGGRVWWVGLPSQRSYVYRRATEAGALLGLEFLSSQQVYYRLLAHALRLKPLVVGTGRLALVGEALLHLRREVPAPGEARLFATAIAEAKRYGLTYKEVAGQDEETQRFRDVFRVYETVKGERWDYDDFRTEALRLAAELTTKGEADLVVVDGFREIGPLELRIYKALAAHTEVWLSLPEAPPGETATHQLEPRTTPPPRSYRAANPVTEARWLLRSLKRDLASGYDPLELAVILPEREVKAFVALGDEYGVPLMDETPKALADTLAGRLLMSLLELPDYPTASRLLAVPDLTRLANAALERGVAGLEAVNVLAKELGLEASWRKWLGLLEVPDNEVVWAEHLLETSLPNLRKELPQDLGWAAFKKHALQRAKEASSLAKGASFRAWWGALLQETFLFDAPKGGVALLTHKLASGRRFKKVYLSHAVEGAYSVGEGEDYFIPEEERGEIAEVFGRLGLPKRFLGRDVALFAELLTRGDETVITYAEAGQGGPNVTATEIVGLERADTLPDLPAASRLELPTLASYTARVSTLPLGTVSLQNLKRYEDCAFRYWAEARIETGETPLWWRELLIRLRENSRLNVARLELLKSDYPEAAPWLNTHAGRLMALNFGVTLPETGDGPRAYLDAAGRSGSEVTLYRFTGPGRSFDTGEAGKYIDGRWNELWAAGHMLSGYGGRVSRVHVLVWPLLAEPVAAYDGGVAYVWRRIISRQDKAEAAHERFRSGDVRPNPGFRCRECRVADVCRAGQR